MYQLKISAEPSTESNPMNEKESLIVTLLKDIESQKDVQVKYGQTRFQHETIYSSQSLEHQKK